MVDFERLRAPFPKDAVSWRAQHISKKDDGTASALALAYIDARDVMNRLDDVCGVAGWQCRYSHANGKTVCDISIKCGEEWVWKADGAGDSDIEAEKGALSDAFKRAAVRWGIGRYLYSLEAVWVPCRLTPQGKWQAWIGDPWSKVKPENRAGFETAKQASAKWVEIKDALMCADSIEELTAIWKKSQPELTIFKRSDPEIFAQVEAVKDTRKKEIEQYDNVAAGMPQGFNEATRSAR